MPINASAKLIQVDIDGSEIGHNRAADVGIVGDARAVLRQLLAAADGRVDAFTCACGTGGTLAGIALALKERNPAVRIVLAAERGGFDLNDVSVSEPSLETVFINLTGRELREQ